MGQVWKCILVDTSTGYGYPYCICEAMLLKRSFVLQKMHTFFVSYICAVMVHVQGGIDLRRTRQFFISYNDI